MLSHIFFVFNSLDGFLALFLSDFVRACVYGALSGTVAILLYSILSNQPRIKALKSETRRLREQMRNPTLIYQEMIRLSITNLAVSLRLLGYVFLPCLFSSIPPMLFILWLSTYHSYALPPGGTPIGVTFVPENEKIVIKPSWTGSDLGNGKRAISVEAGEKIWFGVEDRTIYEGIITEPPVRSVHKKRWWNALMADDTGYIRSDAAVDEIVFAFPRKRFFARGPVWVRTWEFPFAALCLISAITTKWVFKIE